MDAAVVVAGIGAFTLFASVHVLLFRFSRSVQVIRWIVGVFTAVAVFQLALVFFYINGRCPPSMDVLQKIAAAGTAFALYGVCSFAYVICVVGPYETSVRLRIVREVALEESGISETALKQRYGNAQILELRLSRLTQSGDLAMEGGRYRTVRAGSVFSGITLFADFLKRCYGLG